MILKEAKTESNMTRKEKNSQALLHCWSRGLPV
jgi:hypothetical protein